MNNTNRVWKLFKSFTAEKTFTAKLRGGLCFGPERDRPAAPTPLILDNCDVEEDTGPMSTGVEFVLQMSHNSLTTIEEYVQ
jgi:hypothetical protein